MRLKPNTLIVVAGPTASGKTALAIQIAKAVDGEIVSADSMQIYRGVDIATAKPTPEELAAVPHHLIGFLPMDRAFSVADYAELARKEINDILSRGKVPVLCGGTGLYIKAIVDNVQYGEDIPGNEALRENLRQLAEREGNNYLAQIKQRNIKDWNDQDYLSITALQFAIANVGMRQSREVDSEDLRQLEKIGTEIDTYLNDLKG